MNVVSRADSMIIQQSPTTLRNFRGSIIEASPRATKYRPFKKLDAVDADFVALDLTSETQVLLEALPVNATAHFQVPVPQGARS